MTKNFNKYERFFTYLILVILAYGYICRWLDIYFFWESRIIAIPMLLLMMFYISVKIFIREREFLSSSFFYIILCLYGGYQSYKQINLNNEVVEKSIDFIKNNQLIENNVGEIKSVDFPINNKNLSGNDYSITFLVKGEKKYADVIVNSYYQDRNLKNIDNLKFVSFEINDNYNYVE